MRQSFFDARTPMGLAHWMERIAHCWDVFKSSHDIDTQKETLAHFSFPILRRVPLPLEIDGTFVPHAPAIPMRGVAVKSLGSAVNSVMASDVQEVKVIALVQPFGCGKTRCVLELAREGFVVVPWMCIYKPGSLLRNLESRQEALRKDRFPEFGNATAFMNLSHRISEFSRGCLKMTQLYLISPLVLTCLLIKSGALNISNEDERYMWALFLWRDSQCRTESPCCRWQCEWVDQNSDADVDVVLNEAMTGLDMKFVLFLDEVHELRGKCKGFCEHHRETWSDPDGLKWLGEVQRGARHESVRTITDLFYQVRYAFHKNWREKNCLRDGINSFHDLG